ncbi:MAG: O-antigen ligase family protein [Gammaproteobacteria bacterium]|nr:O-antigen ligase family protein [Gammaproteobacteria bacterium]
MVKANQLLGEMLATARREWLQLLLAAWATAFFWLLPFSRLFWVPAILLCLTGLVLLFRVPGFFRGNRVWRCYYVVLLLLAGAVACSAIDALDPGESLETAALYLAYIPLGAALFYLVAKYRFERWMLCILAALAAFWCVDGLVQILWHQDLLGHPATKRLGIYFSSPSKFGFYLPYALVFLFFYPEHKRLPLYLLSLLWLVALFVVVEANTRASTLVFLLLSWTYLLYRWGPIIRRNPLKSLGIGLALPAAMLSVLLIFAVIDEDVRQRVEHSVPNDLSWEALDVALSYRLDLWGATTRAIAANPLNGVGAGNFNKAIRPYLKSDSRFRKRYISHAHQVVLDLLVGTGVIGLAAWLVAVWLLVRQARQGWSGGAGTLWLPFLLALGLLWFPLNTHRSFFSSELTNFSVHLLALFLAVRSAADLGGLRDKVSCDGVTGGALPR